MLMPAPGGHLSGHPREDECRSNTIRAQGVDGQNVSKVSNAAHLRYGIHTSSLPDALKARLLALDDQRSSSDDAVVIKSQDHRSVECNKANAREFLAALIAQAAHVAKARRATGQPADRARASCRRRGWG